MGFVQADYSSLGEKLMVANFGKITAMEAVINQLTLSDTLQLQKDFGVTLLTENLGLIENVSRKILPWERIKLFMLEKSWSLTANLVEELITNYKEQQLILIIQASVNPNDRPGNYEGIFYLQPWKKSQNGIEKQKIIKVLIKLEVAPWIKLDHQELKVNLNEVNSRELSLSNEIPFSLKVASNANWTVSLALNKNNNETSMLVPVSLKLSSIPNSFQGLSKVFRSDHFEFKRIAVGVPTVTSERYWVEIPLKFMIEAYPKYPAGKYQFCFDCLGEIWSN